MPGILERHNKENAAIARNAAKNTAIVENAAKRMRCANGVTRNCFQNERRKNYGF